jgi:hypothetical protein
MLPLAQLVVHRDNSPAAVILTLQQVYHTGLITVDGGVWGCAKLCRTPACRGGGQSQNLIHAIHRLTSGITPEVSVSGHAVGRFVADRQFKYQRTKEHAAPIANKRVRDDSWVKPLADDQGGHRSS